MNLDLIGDLFNNLKENKKVKSFMKELSNSISSNNKISNENFNNLSLDDLTLYGEKIIVKFRDEMLNERAKILQKYSKNTSEKGEMYYIYDINSNDMNSYNLCICEKEKSHEVITKPKEELPEGTTLGSVLRVKNGNFILDNEATQIIAEEINTMIKEKVEEQRKYLGSKRVEGHTFEVGEKYDGRIWLYDLDNVQGSGIEGIEEIEFPIDLYQDAKEGDIFIYQNGKYERK